MSRALRSCMLWLAVGIVLPAAAPAAGPIVFDGFGLVDFEGNGSIAAELERLEESVEQEQLRRIPALAVAMQGAVGCDTPPSPMTAELRSRIDRFDVAAGLVADPDVVVQGPARWMGRVGLSNDHVAGRESVEVRTTVGNNAEWGLLGVELGPRVERRLRMGATFFIDGKAEAQAMRSVETGWWSLPGTSTDGSSMVGVMARTGLVR